MALARQTGAEICSVDAFQVYRGLEIGTAKPSGMARKEIPHHLLDLVEPEEGFTAADYLRAAGAVVADLQKRGKKAVWVGGTGLYHKVLTEGLAKDAWQTPSRFLNELNRDLVNVWRVKGSAGLGDWS